jgi:diguanylate cyclase (GGDEF)-like protein
MSPGKTLPATSAVRFDDQDRLRFFEALAGSTDLQDELRVVVAEVMAKLGIDGILVNLLDEGRKNLICHWISLPPEFDSYRSSFLYYHFPLASEDLNVECFKSARTILADKGALEKSAGATKVRMSRWKIDFLGIVPVRTSADSAPFGTVMLFRTRQAVTEFDADFVKTIFSLAATRLLTAKHHAALLQHEAAFRLSGLEQKEFLELVNRLNGLESHQEIYRLISREFLRRFPVELVTVWLKEGDSLVCKGTTASDPEFMSVADALNKFYSTNAFDNRELETTINEAFVQNCPIYVEDVSAIRHLPMAAKAKKVIDIIGNPRTFLHSPISDQHGPIGVLTLGSCLEIFRPTEMEFHVISLLSTFLGSVIANAKLYDTVKAQGAMLEELNAQLTGEVSALGERALKDRLTGLYNYGYFYDTLDKRVEEFARTKNSDALSLVIFDIDQFKVLNERFGHLAGNYALRDIGRRLEQRARKMDVACRFGGEEFAVILPSCSLENAAVFAEAFRGWVQLHPFPNSGGNIHATISAGCSTSTFDDTAASLIERAEEALKLAKKNGRNRTETVG